MAPRSAVCDYVWTLKTHDTGDRDRYVKTLPYSDKNSGRRSSLQNEAFHTSWFHDQISSFKNVKYDVISDVMSPESNIKRIMQ